MMTAISQFFWSAVARILARRAVVEWLIRRARRTPYSPIIKNDELYMERFWLFNAYPDTGQSGADRRGGFPLSMRLHHIVLPDQDRDLHDHPWNARTVILRGWYDEVRMERPYRSVWDFIQVPVRYRRAAGRTSTLKYGEYHCISALSDGGVWTLFITGRYRGGWGFLVNGVKVPWRRYLGLPDKEAAPVGQALKDHNFRRATLLEIFIIYGLFFGLAIWNWW